MIRETQGWHPPAPAQRVGGEPDKFSDGHLQRDGPQPPAALPCQRPRRQDQHHRHNRGDGRGSGQHTQALLRLAVRPAARRKWLAVIGYGLSALTKPFFYFASSWEAVAGARWVDRAGKGVRTAPRDALVADSIDEHNRGLAFGFHRASDTAGAMVGLLIALGIIWAVQRGALTLGENVFRTIVLVSIVPALLAVVSLAFWPATSPLWDRVPPRDSPSEPSASHSWSSC